MDLSLDLIKGLLAVKGRHTSSLREYRRCQLILEIDRTNPFCAATKFGCCKKTAYRWYRRTCELMEILRKKTLPLQDSTIEKLIRLMLKDRTRSGAPLTYTVEQQCAIIGLAVRSPEEFGLPFTLWTHEDLAMVANRDGITECISASTVGRILSEADLKPHRSKYWEKPNIENEEEFRKQAAFICEIYRSALKRLNEDHSHTVCIDEKTGMQALLRLHPDKPSIPGSVAKVEFEYIRNGTKEAVSTPKNNCGRSCWNLSVISMKQWLKHLSGHTKDVYCRFNCL